MTLTGSADAQAIVKVELLDLGTGSFKVTLLGQLDHPDAAQTGASDQIRLLVPYTVKDATGDTASSTLGVTVHDDGLVGNASVHDLVSGSARTNLLLIIDVSGSQAEATGLTGITRMDLQKATLKEVLDQYDERGDVAVRIVTFSTDASPHGSTWESVASARAFISTLVPTNTTNYDEALSDARTAWADAGKLTGASAVAYFFSDGEPNQPSGSAGISAAEEVVWIDFLTANGILALAFGTGPASTPASLHPVAYDGRTGTNTNAVILTESSEGAGFSVDTFDPDSSTGATGNLASEAAIAGADRPLALRSIGHNGTTYTYDPLTDVVTVSGPPGTYTFNASTNVLSVATGSGGQFSVDFDDANYTYAGPVLTGDNSDTIQPTFRDFDLDPLQQTVTFNITGGDRPPIVRDDRVATNLTGSGVTIQIPDVVLLANDSDRNGDPISIVGVASAVSGSAGHAAGVSSFVDNNSDGGSFVYTGQSNALSDDGLVAIDRSQAGESTLDGTGLRDILFGRDTSSDTLVGYEGDDYLDGGNLNDTVTGGGGDDVIDVSDGNDTVRCTSVLDGTDTVLTFDGNASAGQDVVDLDTLFDSLGAAAASRAALVQIVDNGGVVLVNVNASTASPDFELVVAQLETGDPITVGQDVVVGS